MRGLSVFPLVPKLQLGDAPVGEALLRAGGPGGEIRQDLLSGTVLRRALVGRSRKRSACGGGVFCSSDGFSDVFPSGMAIFAHIHACILEKQDCFRRKQDCFG